ncbi:pyridoxal 5'-phosphate synthase glutaminase subunit PdxT [Chloroflexota bacterium]
MKVGVLALQGAFIEHISVMQQLGVEALAVRLPDELNGLDGLIIPGGESTAILKLMQNFSLIQPLRELAQAGLPILGTCAGMVCLAKKVSDRELDTLSVMDIVVRRNAFGRQVDSFEAELSMPILGDKPFPAVFIRAPFIEKAGPQVEILAHLPDGAAVAARQGKLVASAFHPELTSDLRFHSYFLQIVANNSFK